MTPRLLSIEDVLLLHESRVTRYGGTPGVRDITLLQSALAVPAATFGGAFLHEGIPQMAAAYLFHIAKNHPFLDGNKRTALAAGIAFLELNGWSLEADPGVLTDTVLGVADGTVSKSALSVFFEASTRRRRR
ncbi:MAG TPA: type II toxin-antitoxin system death-on-curing family toxin [Candidatus Limnocylindrales bacterium]|nr:type II toxin-antitoxin system death-on-curing family toxin [Candidatus Limnocylindrales bacterium]